MAFEIVSNSGPHFGCAHRIRPIHRRHRTRTHLSSMATAAPIPQFFDGSHVIFSDGSADFIGRWLQGSAATVICQTRRLCERVSIHIYGSRASPATAPRPVELSRCCAAGNHGLEAGGIFSFHPGSRMEPQSSYVRAPAQSRRAVHRRRLLARHHSARSRRQRNQGRNPCWRVQSAYRVRHRLACYIILNAPIDGLHLSIVPANGKEQEGSYL